jgi:hypothetical protein
LRIHESAIRWLQKDTDQGDGYCPCGNDAYHDIGHDLEIADGKHSLVEQKYRDLSNSQSNAEKNLVDPEELL